MPPASSVLPGRGGCWITLCPTSPRPPTQHVCLLLPPPASRSSVEELPELAAIKRGPGGLAGAPELQPSFLQHGFTMIQAALKLMVFPALSCSARCRAMEGRARSRELALSHPLCKGHSALKTRGWYPQGEHPEALCKQDQGWRACNELWLNDSRGT